MYLPQEGTHVVPVTIWQLLFIEAVSTSCGIFNKRFIKRWQMNLRPVHTAVCPNTTSNTLYLRKLQYMVYTQANCFAAALSYQKLLILEEITGWGGKEKSKRGVWLSWEVPKTLKWKTKHCNAGHLVLTRDLKQRELPAPWPLLLPEGVWNENQELGIGTNGRK